MKAKLITLMVTYFSLLLVGDKSEAATSQRNCHLGNYGYRLAIRIDGNLYREFSSIESLIAELNRMSDTGDCAIAAVPCWLAAHGWHPAIRIRSGDMFWSNSGSIQATANDIAKLAAVGACTVRSRPCSLGTYGTATPSLRSQGAGHLFLMRSEAEVRQTIEMLRGHGLCSAEQ